MTNDRSGKKRVAVIGVGNLLLRDDGVGIHAVQRLAAMSLPPEVVVIDAGTAGLGLLPYLEEADMVVLIDCLNADAEPGTIYRIPATELDLNRSGEAISMHDVALEDVLTLAKSLGKLPPTMIYGVQPAEIVWGMGLSPQVAGVLPRLADLVRRDVLYWLAHQKFPAKLADAPE